MKKNFGFYFCLWLIMLVIFNAVVFLVRPVIPGFTIEYDARFFIAWLFILAAFAGNLACAYFAFKSENLKKMFYNLSPITVSRTALISMLIAGCALMLIPDCPAWITAIVCILIFAFNAIAVIKTFWAADTVDKVDEKIKTQTSFIKNLTADAECLISRAKSDAAKAECKKVYEALRYSDPMSTDAVSSVEAQISAKFDDFSKAVNSGDDNLVKTSGDEITALVKDRNVKIKAGK